ncbi:MAG: hypothetical protein ACTSR8_17650 [Promethearchaeota archaeon]
MNISKFNQELGNKLAKAKNLEKFNDLKEAIQTWLDISEMTLQASKDPHIDNHYRNMLIAKTQEIMKHVRDLKRKYYPKMHISEIAPIKPDLPEIVIDADSPKDSDDRDEIDQVVDNNSKSSSQELLKVRKKEDSEYKNLPKGFIPIKPSPDFKPITPYNEKVVQDRLNAADNMDMSIFKKEEKKSEMETKKNVIICFACGEENPFNVKTCKHCGTKI